MTDGALPLIGKRQNLIVVDIEGKRMRMSAGA